MNDNEKKSSDMFYEFMKKKEEINERENLIQAKKEESKKIRTVVDLFSVFFDWINKLFYDILLDRKKTLIFSCLLAIIFYVSVKGEDVTTIKKLSNVEIRVLNLSDDKVISDIPETCDVYLEGTQFQLSTSLMKNNAYVYVDVNGLDVGEYKDYELKIEGINSNLKALIAPDSLSFNIYNKSKVLFDISSRIINGDPSKVYALPQLSQTSVTCVGSEEQINKIGKVEVVFDVGDLISSSNVVGRVVAYDLYNKEISGIEFDYDTIEANISIVESSKEVELKPKLTGDVSKHQRIVENVDFEVNKATIYGTKSDLEKINYLEVEIPCLNVNEEIMANYSSVIVPDQVISSINSVQTTIHYAYKNMAKYEIPVEIVGTNASEYKVDVEQVEVEVYGATNTLANLNVKNIHCIVNLDEINKETGQGNLELKFDKDYLMGNILDHPHVIATKQ